MENKGKLYLIPTIIAEGAIDTIPPATISVLKTISHFLAEDIRTARRFLSSLGIYPSIEQLHFSTLDKNTEELSLTEMFAPVSMGNNVGILSESGCPGVADPGALAVNFAHRNSIQVIP